MADKSRIQGRTAGLCPRLDRHPCGHMPDAGNDRSRGKAGIATAGSRKTVSRHVLIQP